MKITFVSHDASVSGAPIACLRLAEYMKSNGHEISFVLRSGGGLMHKFKNIGLTCEMNPSSKSDKVLERDLKDFYKKVNSEVIVINTAVPGDIAAILKKITNKRIPIIAYIHELQDVIDMCAGNGLFEKLKSSANYYIANDVVKKNLLKRHKDIKDKKITTLNYSISEDYFLSSKKNTLRSNLKTYNITSNDFVIFGSGPVSPRKGTDIFVEIARKISKKNKKVKFVWMGETHDTSEFTLALKKDIELAGLNNLVHFIGIIDKPYEYFGAADLFLLTSREEPFGMVSLEAGAAGVPTIAFQGAGGISSYIKKDAGFLVENRDTDEVCRIINDIFSKKISITKYQEAAIKRARSYRINSVGRRFEKTIISLSKNKY